MMALSKAISLLSIVSLVSQSIATSQSVSSQNAFDPPQAYFGAAGQDAGFDYVIAGGGTAGLTVAARLVQGGFSVAVIEAGSFYEIDNGNLSVIPSDDVFFAGASPTDVNPLIDWGFVTSPQAGMNGRVMHYPRGKCLGGSSARNYMTYQRGTTGSYAWWASLVGDNSYQLSNFMPYFEKSITFHPPQNQLRAANASVGFNPLVFSSSGSPVQVSYAIWANAYSSFVKLGYEQLGLKSTLDFVSGVLSGIQYCMNTIDPTQQTRSSSDEFIRLIGVNPKFQIFNGTLARQIVFNNNTATGVIVNTNGVNYTLSASKEVIVSTGAVQTPQLLMVSGVGPAATLQEFGIPIISNLTGVGQNMWDHLLFGTSYQVSVPTHSLLTNFTFLAETSAAYRANGSGPLGNPGGDLLGWERIPGLSSATTERLAQFPSDWPFIEYLTLDAYAGNNENYITGAPQTPFMYASPSAAVVAPLSRGNITISSPSTEDPPVINPNWLTDPADQEMAIAAFKRIRTMVNTKIVQSVTVGPEVFPGLNVSTDAQILNAIKDNGITVFHGSATCKMGKSTDHLAVVDNQCRVFGTKNLRVIDASAFPFLPPGHPQSTVYALAEKIVAEMLLG